MIKDRDIICLSTHFWDDSWFRKQHFMSRFAECNRVLYVEPSFSIVRRPASHLEDIATNRFVRPRLESRSASLHLLKPPRALPKWHDPRVERITFRRFCRLVGDASKALDFQDPILWVYHPAYWHGIDSIPHAELVFDLVDDLTAYSGAHPRAVGASISELARRSDLMVVTAERLRERYSSEARRIVRIPNGFDPELFNVRVAPAQALRDVPKPILGFVGTLFGYLDYDLLRRVALAHSDKSMVLVGRVDPLSVSAFDRLNELDNVWHFGMQPQRTVPSFIAGFDVCLCPFQAGDVADSVSPLKVYEYLAMGKPVVSTPMASLEAEPIADCVNFVRGASDFATAVQDALDSDSAGACSERIRTVSPYSWDELFAQLNEAAAG